MRRNGKKEIKQRSYCVVVVRHTDRVTTPCWSAGAQENEEHVLVTHCSLDLRFLRPNSVPRAVPRQCRSALNTACPVQQYDLDGRARGYVDLTRAPALRFVQNRPPPHRSSDDQTSSPPRRGRHLLRHSVISLLDPAIRPAREHNQLATVASTWCWWPVLGH